MPLPRFVLPAGWRSGLLLFGLLLGLLPPLRAQALQPGYERGEMLELLRLQARMADDSIFWQGIRRPERFRLAYRARIVGLDNRWELWHDGRGTVVVSLRGTTIKPESWLENFYAALLPATGELQLGPQRTWHYQLADNPRAAVHAGWLLGTALMADDVLARLDSCYRQGIRNVLLAGHSQGGALAYLMTAHLRHLQQQGRLPADLRLKTYCSAAPKPGNLYFAYDYEALTYSAQGSWSLSVVNPVDWVPETPISIQTINDFNAINPFTQAPQLMRPLPWPKKLALRYVLGHLDRPTRRAQRVYERYLGRLVAKQVHKYQPAFRPGPYAPTNNYTRIGPTLVLRPDAAYAQRFPSTDKQQIFMHHLFQPYVYLVEHLPQ